MRTYFINDFLLLQYSAVDLPRMPQHCYSATGVEPDELSAASFYILTFEHIHVVTIV